MFVEMTSVAQAHTAIRRRLAGWNRLKPAAAEATIMTKAEQTLLDELCRESLDQRCSGALVDRFWTGQGSGDQCGGHGSRRHPTDSRWNGSTTIGYLFHSGCNSEDNSTRRIPTEVSVEFEPYAIAWSSRKDSLHDS